MVYQDLQVLLGQEEKEGQEDSGVVGLLALLVPLGVPGLLALLALLVLRQTLHLLIFEEIRSKHYQRIAPM